MCTFRPSGFFYGSDRSRKSGLCNIVFWSFNEQRFSNHCISSVKRSRCTNRSHIFTITCFSSVWPRFFASIDNYNSLLLSCVPKRSLPCPCEYANLANHGRDNDFIFGMCPMFDGWCCLDCRLGWLEIDVGFWFSGINQLNFVWKTCQNILLKIIFKFFTTFLIINFAHLIITSPSNYPAKVFACATLFAKIVFFRSKQINLSVIPR